MKLTLLPETTEFPLQKMGYMAGVCWNAPLNDIEKNKKRAISCIKADHGRVMEYVNIEVVIDECSARCMREIYTHIAGVTRLQSSTRYISEQNGFGFYIPPKIGNNTEIRNVYTDTMSHIQQGYNKILDLGATKEDAANLLPLGMDSKMVWKLNLRTLVNFMHKRLCTRALKEIREFAIELKDVLAEKNDEWAMIAQALFVPQCEMYKYRNENLVFCQEDHCCGKHKKIEDINVTG